MSAGYEKRTREAGVDFPEPISVPSAVSISSGWVTLATWTEADCREFVLIGDGSLYGHIGWVFGDTSLPGPVVESFPHEYAIQWVRKGGDVTQRSGPHRPGEARVGGRGVYGPETLSLADFPFRFQVWQRGGLMVVQKYTTAIGADRVVLADAIAPSGTKLVVG